MAREKRLVPTFHFPDLDKDEDVEIRELTVAIDGTARPATQFPDTTADTDLGQFAVGQLVTVSHVDIDAAGNRSKARVTSLTVADTVAPPEPGEAGISVREVWVDVPDVAPPVTEEPAPTDSGTPVPGDEPAPPEGEPLPSPDQPPPLGDPFVPEPLT